MGATTGDKGVKDAKSLTLVKIHFKIINSWAYTITKFKVSAHSTNILSKKLWSVALRVKLYRIKIKPIREET